MRVFHCSYRWVCLRGIKSGIGDEFVVVETCESTALAACLSRRSASGVENWTIREIDTSKACMIQVFEDRSGDD